METIKTDRIEAKHIEADTIEARAIVLKNAQGQKIALTYELLKKLADQK